MFFLSGAFQNVPNLCLNNPTGQVFFSHPTDPTKFMQCDINGRMYIIQCPVNEGRHIQSLKKKREKKEQKIRYTLVFTMPADWSKLLTSSDEDDPIPTKEGICHAISVPTSVS